MATIAAVAAGGSLGTLARYGLDAAIERRSFSLFPWSTFAINMSGCFLVGILIAALVDRHHAPHWLRIGLVVGFCGAYTTFSTFAQETYGLVEEKAVAVALLNATASVGLGVLAVFIGERVGRML
ncbi:MAG: fluoride exporter [Gaiellaceae bacterium]|jgi:CrcB protein|nr:fluoride exporter [Gaiellaceae bacterium]